MAGSKTWYYIRNILKNNIIVIMSIALISLITIFLNLLTPIIFKIIIDKILPHKSFKMLIEYVLILILIPIICSFIGEIKSKNIYFLSDQVSRNLRFKAFESCLKMKMCEFDKIGAQKMLQYITKGIGQISDVYISNNVINMITYSIQLIGITIVLFMFNFKIALCSMLIIPIIYMTLRNQRNKIKNSDKNFFDELNSGEKLIFQSLIGVKTVRMFCGETHEKEKLKKWLNDNYRIGWKAKWNHDFATNILPSALSQMMYGIIFIVCSFFIIQSKLTIGELVAVIAYIPQMFIAVTGLLTIQIGKKTADVYTDCLDEIFNKSSESGVIEEINIQDKDCVRFDNVKFSYGRQDFNLKIDDLTVKNGEFITFVGESGGGKSTIIDLLMKFYTPNIGSIYFNGIDIKYCTPKFLRSNISVVPQDIFLWDDDIVSNIIYPDLLPDKKRLDSSIKAASLEPFINRLPDKEHTNVGAFADSISGGERQRIAIARAIYHNADILILDEPTSALDSIITKDFIQYLESCKGQKTIIMISHQIHNAVSADNVAVIKNGEIHEYGSPSELIKKRGMFYKLYINEKNKSA